MGKGGLVFPYALPLSSRAPSNRHQGSPVMSPPKNINRDRTRPKKGKPGEPLTPHHVSGLGKPPKLTWSLFTAICETLRQTGARHASCEAHGISGCWVKKKLNELSAQGFKEWEELWEQSLQLHADRLEAEAQRRAVEGFSEPVYYKGKVVGHVRRYSDNLLIEMLRGTRPEKFRQNVKVDANVSGGVLVVPAKMSVEEFLAEERRRAGEV